MINSRKAIWADNLHCAHVLKLPRVAIVFFVCFFLYMYVYGDARESRDYLYSV